MSIQYLDAAKGGGCRASISHGVVTFTGHIGPKGDGLAGQSTAVLERLEEQLCLHGLRKEDILCVQACVADATQAGAFADVLTAWLPADTIPAITLAQQSPDQHTASGALAIELTLMAAQGPVKRLMHGTKTCASAFGGIVYFPGLTSAEDTGALAQCTAILARYEALFTRFGISRQGVVSASLYLAPGVEYDALRGLLDCYFSGCEPAVLRVCAAPGRDAMGRDPLVMLSLWVAEDAESVTRYEAGAGQSTLVTSHGTGYFSALGTPAKGHDVAAQTRAIMQAYDQLFERYHIAHTAVINSFHRNMDTYPAYSEARAPWRQRFCCAGLSVQSPSVQADTDLLIRYIVSMDGG